MWGGLGWLGWVCVVWWHLVSVKTYGVMYDHTFSELPNHQIIHQATHIQLRGQPGDCIWGLLIFLRCLCGYVWVNILTSLPPRVMWGREERRVMDRLNQMCLHSVKSNHGCSPSALLTFYLGSSYISDGNISCTCFWLQMIFFVHSSTASLWCQWSNLLLVQQ